MLQRATKMQAGRKRSQWIKIREPALMHACTAEAGWDFISVVQAGKAVFGFVGSRDPADRFG